MADAYKKQQRSADFVKGDRGIGAVIDEFYRIVNPAEARKREVLRESDSLEKRAQETLRRLREQRNEATEPTRHF